MVHAGEASDGSQAGLSVTNAPMFYDHTAFESERYVAKLAGVFSAVCFVNFYCNVKMQGGLAIWASSRALT